MAVVGQVAPLGRREQLTRITAQDLDRRLGEDIPQRQEKRAGDTGADPALLAAEKIHDRQGLVGPGKDVEVQRVDLPEGGPHPPDLRERSPRE